MYYWCRNFTFVAFLGDYLDKSGSKRGITELSISISAIFLILVSSAFAFQVEVQQVCFSPDGRCTFAIVKQIDNAKSEIFIQAYSFTSAPIAKALINAHKRGINIEAILDKSNVTGNYSSATFLSNNGIPVFIDAVHAIAHNKLMVIDKEIVITGSFNFTKAAEEKNAENLLIIKSKELSKTYIENWIKHKEHSQSYK